MDAHSLQALRESKWNLLEVLEVQPRDWGTEHYKLLIKKAANEAKLIITTASHYLLQLKHELKEFKDVLRRVNIKMAEQVLEITSKGLFTDGEKLSENEKDDLTSLKSDEFRFEYGEAESLHDRQVQIKLNLDIKKSIRQTRMILDEVDDDIMVNTVAVEELEDFIQKWAEKLIEEEETNKGEENEKDIKEDADMADREDVKDKTEEQTERDVNENGEDDSTIDDKTVTQGDEDGKDNDGDIPDDIDKETLKQEMDAISNDDKRLPTRSKTLLSMKTDKLDAIPETDADDSEDNDEENMEEDNTDDKMEGDNGLSKDEEARSTVTEVDESDKDKKENMNVDDHDKDINDDNRDDDLETLMLNELQEQEAEQELYDPFPPEEWDTFIYHKENKQPDKNGQEIICAVVVKREMLRQNDVVCSVSHNINDLRACLKNKYEKLLSYFVTVKFLRGSVDAGECYVFVPYQPPYKKLKHVIRIRSHEGQWMDLQPENVTNLPSVPGINFSGITIQDMYSSAGLIVILKENQIQCQIPDAGIAIEPAEERNITILVSPDTFGGETSLSFSTDYISTERLDAYKKDNTEFKNIASVSARLHVVCEEATVDDLSVVFYDLLRPESSGSRSPEKEALRRCWRHLVNGIDVNKLLDRMVEKGAQPKTLFKGNSVNDFRQKVETEESAGDKARMFLREIEKGDTEDILEFVTCLRESGHALLAILFTDMVDRIAKESKSLSASTRGSNPDIKVLIRRDDGPWVPNSAVTISERPDDFLVALPLGGKEYHVIVVNLSAQMMKRDLYAFGDLIVNDASGSRTSLICRQHSTHPEKIVLQCVRSEIAASRIRHLKDNGYTLGLEEDIQFGMCDGETLEITFDLNLGLVDIGEDGILRMCYFSHLDTAQFVGDLFLVDERAQSQEPVFSGDLYFNVGSVKQRPPRTGCVKVTLPKSVVPYIDRTPFRMLDVQVIALAKFIGFRLGNRGRDSVLQFASCLVDDEDLRRRLYVKVRRVCRGKDDRARCEMFIINWARQRLKFENKVILLLDALGFEPDIQADAKDFALVYSNSGILCDHYLQKMSEFIGEEWLALGRNLCVPERDLRLLRIDFKDRAVRNFKLLDTFRFSRIAIEQGTSVIRFLLRACKSAGCTGGLITFIRYIAGIFKELTFMRPQSWMSMSSAMPPVEIT